MSRIGDRLWALGRFVAVWSLAFALVTGCSSSSDDDGGGEDTAAVEDTVGGEDTPTGEDIPSVDEDTTTGEDTVDPVTGELALVYALSTDGLTVTAEFNGALDAGTVTAEAFSVTDADGAAGPAVTDVVADGREVTVTLGEALDTEKVWTLNVVDVLDTDGDALATGGMATEIKGTLYLALIWHQHQPVYIDPAADHLLGPWVRKHATKDYYDMAGMLEAHPDVHVMVNLTPVLLMQLQEFYLDRMSPFIDVDANTIDAAGYLAQRDDGLPISDPWVDMLLMETPEPADLTDAWRGWYYENIWSCFSISEVMIARFPEYQALADIRNSNPETFTKDDLLQMKGFFELAWFDPDFLRGPVTMPDGSVVDLSDLVTEDEDGNFTLNQPFTEEICQRLVVEDYKVMANVVGIHEKLKYDVEAKTGQIEMMTTPYYHPILPLIYNSELASIAMPTSPLPPETFSHPTDANVHVAKAVRRHAELFGTAVSGMWPAEGSVAEDVIGTFHANGVRWIATDRRVLERSTPADQPIYTPYRVDVDTEVGDGGDTDDELAIVFRDTEISDKLGFHYQGETPEDNVADLRESLRKHAPAYGTEHMLTLILDGENAWEWYRLDNDAKLFLDGMYVLFEEQQATGELRTTCVSEWLDGNEARGIAPHPVHDLPELEPLHAGSWIGGDYAIWIGEEEENVAWTYLKATRDALAGFEAQGLARPDVDAPIPAEGTNEWYAWKAWETMYSAEGSDWFWWYGSDQTAVGGDEPFDRIFRELLRSVYRYAQLAGIPTEVPDFPPVLRRCDAPAGPLSGDPTIDGVFDPDDMGDLNEPNEWTELGAGVCMDPDSGAEVLPEDVIGVWFHGMTETSLHVAMRLNFPIEDYLGEDFQLRLYFSHKHIVSIDDENYELDPMEATTQTGDPIAFRVGGAARQLVIDFAGTSADAPTPAVGISTPADGGWEAPAEVNGVLFGAAGTVVEMTIPLAAINYQAEDPLEMLITTTQGMQELDRVPQQGGVTVYPDRSLLVEVTLVVDCTGSVLPLDEVKSIDNPPPPAGTGTVFIVGNRAELGDWTPNTIPMFDDGATGGDETAGDNMWSFQLLVPPMTDIQYKYTIGSSGDGWGPTEEYPLTNRGFLVSDADGDQKMVVHDVFADRPNPSGALGALTEIAND